MYTVDYFINKFTNTRDDMWCVGKLYDEQGRNCANGWCGFRHFDHMETFRVLNYITDEAKALWDLFHPEGVNMWGGHIGSEIVAEINNGESPRYQQDTPKKRILAALYDIKNPKPELSLISAEQLMEQLEIKKELELV